MKRIISVRFKPTGKSYYFSPENFSIETGNYVIVETSHGIECGEVTQGVHEVPDSMVSHTLKPVLRIADDADIRQMNQNRNDEKEAFTIAEERILKHGLEMKLVDVEYAHNRSKILFFFTADGRVDFRELVKDLASIFRTRIELRQIGVRDESKMLGGLGICGQPFCCSRFLKNFQPVSIKMAKEQGLSLNPTKISGSCGRLMCCLSYEQEAYEHLNKITPRVGSLVKTPEGDGTILEVNLVSGNLRIRMESSQTMIKYFHRDECKFISSGKKGNKKGTSPTEEEKQNPEQ